MSFECPVCYNKGESGLVIPQSCQHKICLTCYTNIVIKNPTAPCCPQCRKNYVKKEDLVSQETSISQDQLLIDPLDPIDNLIFETAFSNTMRRNPIENLIFETAISNSILRPQYNQFLSPRMQLYYISRF
jgi:hypothetical protein